MSQFVFGDRTRITESLQNENDRGCLMTNTKDEKMKFWMPTVAAKLESENRKS